jgi:hypothetical protein
MAKTICATCASKVGRRFRDCCATVPSILKMHYQSVLLSVSRTKCKETKDQGLIVADRDERMFVFLYKGPYGHR